MPSQLAAEALLIQNACNPLGLARSFAEATLELSDRLEADMLPCSTDAVRNHCVFRLWASKLHDLANMGLSDTDRFRAASEQATRLADQNQQSPA